MENINFCITKEDIQYYLQTHQEFVLHKEALFVRYLREMEQISLEVLDILGDKYNGCSISHQNMNLIDFKKYLHFQELDMSGICHIMISALGFFYGEKNFSYTDFNTSWYYPLTEQFQFGNMELEEERNKVLMNVIENYMIAGQIEKYRMLGREYYTIVTSTFDCSQQLVQYEDIYGSMNVWKVKKFVKEGVK